MKCIICEVCGDYIPHGSNVWRVDSIFEQEEIKCCQKCAELYHGYPEALTRISGNDYESLKFVDIITNCARITRQKGIDDDT